MWQINKCFLQFFLSLILLSCINYSFGQQIPKNTASYPKPPLYKYPNNQILSVHSKDASTNFWIVYSDRNLNTTYQDPHGGKPKNEAQFMDPFIVIDEKGEYFHIVKATPEVRAAILLDKKRLVPVDAVDFGWIEKKKMLLWENCLVTEPQKIARKALSVITDDKVFDNIARYVGENNEIILYGHPDADPKYQNGKSIRLAQFMFVYKEDRDCYLVGKNMAFNYGDRDNSLLGWVPKTVVKEWSTRICYEPNWDGTAAEDRMSRQIKASLFATPADAVAFYDNGQYTTTAEWNDDTYTTRMSVNEKRFPVLDVNEDIFETGFVTDIFDEKGKTVLDAKKYAATEKTANEQIRKAVKSINIMYVIDGDPSLKDYNDKVTDAISKNTESFEQLKGESSQNAINIAYGAVVYYPVCSNIEKTFAVKSISTNESALVAWIQTQLNQSVSCPGGDRRSLFDGLDRALNEFGGNRSTQSNYIILIGSAGDVDDASKKAKLVEKMNQSLEGIVAFQVNTGQSTSFEDFLKQLRDVTMKTAERINADIRSNPDFKPKIASGEIKLTAPSYKKDAGVIAKYRLEASTDGLTSTIIYSQVGQPFKVDLFAEALDTLSFSLYNRVQAAIAMYDDNMQGVGERGIQLTPQYLRYLNRIGKSEKDFLDNVQFSISQNYQFFIRTYFKEDATGLEEPVFKPVLLLSLVELSEFNSLLRKFNSGNTEDETRENYYNAFKGVLKTYLGDEISDEELGKKSAAEAMSMISDLKKSTKLSGLLAEYSLDDIRNTKKFDKNKLMQLESYMSKKADGINRYLNDQSAMFPLFDDTCFWLPQELLP